MQCNLPTCCYNLQSLAEKYGKTPAQLVLRWGLQRNTVVIPKTSKAERLKENFEVFDFEISGEDMEKMKAIDRKYRTNQPAKFWGIDLYAQFTCIAPVLSCVWTFLNNCSIPCPSIRHQ